MQASKVSSTAAELSLFKKKKKIHLLLDIVKLLNVHFLKLCVKFFVQFLALDDKHQGVHHSVTNTLSATQPVTYRRQRT